MQFSGAGLLPTVSREDFLFPSPDEKSDEDVQDNGERGESTTVYWITPGLSIRLAGFDWPLSLPILESDHGESFPDIILEVSGSQNQDPPGA